MTPTSLSTHKSPFPASDDRINDLRTPQSGWYGIGALTYFTTRKLLLNPFLVGFSIILPLFMYMLFGAGRDYSDIWVVHTNAAASVLVNMGLYGIIVAASSVASNIALERISGISRLFALTPISGHAFFCARLCALSILNIITLAVVYIIGYFTGARMHPETWLYSFSLIIALCLLPVTIGLAFAFLLRSDGVFAVTSCVIVLSSFASGLFIPLNQMGSFMQSVAPWTPLYGIFQLSQIPVYGWDNFHWGYAVNYAVWTVFFGVIAIWAQRHDTAR
ncbi:ABC transporter permease [Schaalia sp. lx-100]|uniref:ABC transporter permease n=1 Tax=Schaalia sp. lx-100 TaxID=2899081 RepID=UPI001E38B4FF|nr:ABC transporter permease [Schaalia sp. lx-100]MCD4557815.1 ABC transporter permease [Schaalia sp. lx-100]